MCEVIVLFNGYSKNLGDGKMDANCTCTLIIGPKLIIIDSMPVGGGKSGGAG
ncbi:hypothetical protein ALC57_11834 [Trachymyrmex cornetzi]|uniref:Uncharacterized protein n=1 Tax=Trachymyrmex cornetzi TaxID=471704 RepID=A0A151J1S9_9HYME|nr:hypothetical protein ALC57_11834 [Trachymyrmex cornetzi]